MTNHTNTTGSNSTAPCVIMQEIHKHHHDRKSGLDTPAIVMMGIIGFCIVGVMLCVACAYRDRIPSFLARCDVRENEEVTNNLNNGQQV